MRKRRDLGDANSPRCRAAATPRGIEIISDPTAMRAVPESKGQIPKLGLRPLGTQSVPVMNSKKVASSYSKKRIVPDASVYTINALAITDNEAAENNALWVNRLRGARPSRKVPDSIMIYHFIVHANAARWSESRLASTNSTFTYPTSSQTACPSSDNAKLK